MICMNSIHFPLHLRAFRFIPILLMAILIFSAFTASLHSLETDRAAEDLQQLQTALTRAAVSCYAAEGVYPPDLQYLQDHYGIQINTDLYSVQYEYIASNLMPDITILELAK